MCAASAPWAASWALPAQASAAAGLAVVPRPAAHLGLGYFKLSARAGRAQPAGSIELRNSTPRPLRVVLSAVDGQTVSTLGSTYAQPQSAIHGSARWLSLSRRRVSIAPGSAASVAVAVAVPRRAAAGDYLSGVSVEQLGQTVTATPARGTSVASAVRYAIGVEVSLPGVRHRRIVFTGAGLERQPGGLAFLLYARNSGNAILQGVHGAVRITRGSRTVVSRAIPPGTFVTGTSIAYPVTALHELPPLGTRYRVSAWLRYHGGVARLNTTVTFGQRADAIQRRYLRPAHAVGAGGVATWMIGLLAAAVLYGAFATVQLVRQRRRASEAASAERDRERSGV